MNTAPLNPWLYNQLMKRFKEVRVNHPGVRFRYEFGKDETGRPTLKSSDYHEQYQVCCPICGDNRFRLCISSAWLTQPVEYMPRLTHLAVCYNEHCPVTKEEFYSPFLYEADKWMNIPAVVADPPRRELISLPNGFRKLDTLPEDHPVLVFLRKQYFDMRPKYLAEMYDVGFTDEYDERYRLAKDRIIFPMYQSQKLVAWQGRRIDGLDIQKWVLSPGFRRMFYNGDNVPVTRIPIICEGITSSIACGPFATAVCNKIIDDRMAQEAASRWQSVVILTDPETFVLDKREKKPAVYAEKMAAMFNKHLKIPAYSFKWPEELLELARRKVNREKVKVPDSADLGMDLMYKLLDAQLPASHRGCLV